MSDRAWSVMSDSDLQSLTRPRSTDSRTFPEKLDDLMKQVDFLKKEHTKQFEYRKLTKAWCTRDLVTCAGEIWKRCVLKGGGGGETGLWDANKQQFVQGAGFAMRMSENIPVMMEISRECILACNDAAHFITIKSLDEAVLNSERAILMFPELKTTHASQCKTIMNYGRFKTFLPDNFI